MGHMARVKVMLAGTWRCLLGTRECSPHGARCGLPFGTLFGSLFVILFGALLSACATQTVTRAPSDVESPAVLADGGQARSSARADRPAAQALADLTADAAVGLAGAAAVDATANWHNYVLPGKQPTQYHITTKAGRWAVEARAVRSASLFRRQLDLAPESLSALSWSWWVDAPMAGADLGDINLTDAPARIVLTFEGDKSKLPARARMLFDLARAITGEEPPYATLVYAWATDSALESVVTHPRSDRIRKIVVDSGAAQTRRWREHHRNIVEDYRRAFGEEPGRLIGVAMMTDADNTRSQTRAWYGRILLALKAEP